MSGMVAKLERWRGHGEPTRRGTPQPGGTFPRHDDRDRDVARRPPDRPAPEGPRRDEALHAVRRPSLLDLRRLPRRGDRHRRRAPRVRGRVRGRGLGQGHARAGRVRADGGPGRHERDERGRLGAAQQLADARARRPGAGDALGPGVPAGDRPRAVHAAADQARRDRRVPGRDPRPRRRGAARGGATAHGARVPGLPARRRLQRGRRAGARARDGRVRRGPRPARARPRGGAAARAPNGR